MKRVRKNTISVEYDPKTKDLTLMDSKEKVCIVMNDKQVQAILDKVCWHCPWITKV